MNHAHDLKGIRGDVHPDMLHHRHRPDPRHRRSKGVRDRRILVDGPPKVLPFRLEELPQRRRRRAGECTRVRDSRFDQTLRQCPNCLVSRHFEEDSSASARMGHKERHSHLLAVPLLRKKSLGDRTSARERSPVSIDEIIQNMPERYRVGSAKESTTFYFSIGAHKYTVRIDPERCTVEAGRQGDADVILKTTPELFERMVIHGKLPGPIDLARGKLKTNDPIRLQRLRDMFEQP